MSNRLSSNYFIINCYTAILYIILFTAYLYQHIDIKKSNVFKSYLDLKYNYMLQEQSQILIY